MGGANGAISALKNKEFRGFLTYLVFVVLFSVGKAHRPSTHTQTLRFAPRFGDCRRKPSASLAQTDPLSCPTPCCKASGLVSTEGEAPKI